MTFKLLTAHYMEFLSLKGSCTSSSESTLVKMPHCLISHVTAHIVSLQCAMNLLCQRMKNNFDADLGAWQAVTGEIMNQIARSY